MNGIEHSLDGEYQWFHFVPTLMGMGFFCTIDYALDSGFSGSPTQLLWEAGFFLLGVFWSALLLIRSAYCAKPIQEFVNGIYATAGFIVPVGIGISWGSALMMAL